MYLVYKLLAHIFMPHQIIIVRLSLKQVQTQYNKVLIIKLYPDVASLLAVAVAFFFFSAFCGSPRHQNPD
jgi:hypothetical protein